MNPDFQKQFDNAINDYAKGNQYGVSMIPAHTHNGTDSLRVDYNDLVNKTIYLQTRIVASGTNTAVANVVGGDLVMSFAGYINGIGATVDTAGTTNVTTIDVNKNGSSIMVTKITIDSGEKTSRTAATPPVLNNTLKNFTIGDILTFDVDAISTTPAKGLTIFIDVIQTRT